MINKEVVTTKEQLDELYNSSALSWEGLCPDDENLLQVKDWLEENKVDTKNLKFHIIKGRTMNKAYHLNKNAYKNNLNIISVTGIDTTPVIFARFSTGGRWFDDIVDNNQE